MNSRRRSLIWRESRLTWRRSPVGSTARRRDARRTACSRLDCRRCVSGAKPLRNIYGLAGYLDASRNDKSGDSLEEPAHRFVVMNAANRVGEQWRDAQDLDVRQLLVGGQRNAVGNDDLPD